MQIFFTFSGKFEMKALLVACGAADSAAELLFGDSPALKSRNGGQSYRIA